MKLQSGNAELVATPELGGTIASWRVGDVDLFRPTEAGASTVREQACYPLIPFSNRVAGRAFSFRGTRHELPAIMGPFAIHGAAWQCPWRQDGPRMRLDYPGGPLWPFAFSAEQRFELSAHALTITVGMTNRHSGPAPAAIGLHPFFPRTPAMTLQFAATSVWRNGEADMIPVANTQIPPEWDFATPRRPESVALDNCFAGWHRTASITWPEHRAQLDMQADRVFRHLVVFIPKDGTFMAVEPVANMNDGLNRMDQHVDHGMTVLEPGQTLSGAVRFKVTLA